MDDAEKLRLLLERRKAIINSRTDLISFAKYLSPDPLNRADVLFSAYQDAKHHRVIAKALEDVESGACKRLVISCPPRHGKTRLASQLFPAWFAGRNPGQSMIAATYNEKFSWDMGRAVRTLIRSPLYQHVFPGIGVKQGAAAVDRVETDNDATLFWVGRGGTITGRGGDLLLIDDPIKDRKEADSPTIRDQLWDWYTTVMRTRMMTKDGRIVIISTRWHEDDLIGRLMDQSSPYYSEEEAASWKIIDLPALAEDDDVLGRMPGEALWPERFDVPYLLAMKRNDARGFQALYQGHPTPADGSFFKADHIRLYHKMSDLPDKSTMRFYAASDHAVAIDQGNDKTALIVVGVDQEDNIWIMPDVIWARITSDRAVEGMVNLMERYKPILWWGERGQISKSIGPFLRKRMFEKRVFCGMDEITPIGDKQQRAQSIYARMSMGKVRFPSFAPWFSDARDQMLKFPQGAHDDFVDAMSLIGLGLSKQRPGKLAIKRPDGVKEGTLGWVKQQSDSAERQKRASNNGW